MKNEDRRPYRINGKDIVVDADNANYTNASMEGVETVADALDYLKENGGGGGGESVTVDAVPTENSTNAVSSGGVYDAINDKLSEVIVNSLDPGDVAVIDDVTTGGSTNVLSAEQGKKLNTGKQARMEIFVAASDAPSWQKAGADYICDGTNDEVEIQNAINFLQNTGGRIRLSAGNFYIDSLPNTRADDDFSGNYKVGLMIPAGNGVEYIIEGDTFLLTKSKKSACGTCVWMSDTLYDSLSDADNERYALFAPSLYGSGQAGSLVSLQMRNLSFRLPWNGKKITCLDTHRISRVTLQYITCRGFREGYNPNWDFSRETGQPIPMPVEHCIGIRSVGGGNWGTCADYKNVLVQGFYEGFNLAGEHIVGINMATIGNYYGYTFGNRNYTGISCHTMTLINCSDEQSACGPRFVKCNQYQDVHLIGWNEERDPLGMPGKTRVQNATVKPLEVVNNQTIKWGTIFRGTITYAIMKANWVSDVNEPFWEAGHGENFVTRNSLHKNAASWSEIQGYKGDLGEIIYDTTNNRLVVCTAVSASGTTWRAIATTSV